MTPIEKNILSGCAALLVETIKVMRRRGLGPARIAQLLENAAALHSDQLIFPSAALVEYITKEIDT